MVTEEMNKASNDCILLLAFFDSVYRFSGLTLHITGSKKQSEERAALFAVRVHVIAMCVLHDTFSQHISNNRSFIN